MSQNPADNTLSNKIPFQLGALRIDPNTRRIEKDSESLTCEPKVFDLLLYFCAQDGEIVTRDQLLADIWQGRIVSDNAINRKIYQLRKLLASLDSEQEYIETIPKFGYRLSHTIIVNTPSTLSDTDKQPPEQSPIEQTFEKTTPWRWISAAVVVLALFIIVLNTQPTPDKPPELKQLTALQGLEADASLSPDGRYLLFSYAQTDKSRQLILQDNQSGQRQNLTDTQHFDVRGQWHPNGKKIAFIRVSNNPDERCVIYQMNLLPTVSQPQRLINCAYANMPSITWGASTNKLFIAEREKKTQPYRVFSLDTSTSNKQQLTLGTAQSNMRGDYFVRRNLDGSQVTILSYLGSNQVKIGIYNSEPFALDSEFLLEAHINDIAWHPVTGWFYFRSGQHIYKVDNAGQSRQQVFHLGSAFGGLSFSGDGKQLLMSSSVNDTDIWQLQITTNPESKSSPEPTNSFIGSTRRDSRPRFANTSKTLAFVSNRSGKNAFWLRNENGQVSKLANLEIDVGYPNFIWSPDDSQLLFEYQEQIYTLEIATGKLDVMLDKSYLAYVATWSSDGKNIYYGSTRSGDWQMWSYNLADKTSKQLTTNGGYSGYDNPVDGLFYFSKYHQDGLWRINGDGSESLVIEQFSLLNWLNWRIVNNQVYYVLFGQEIAGIYRFDLTTLRETLVLKHVKGTLHDYSASFDGSVLTYTKHISQSGDVFALQL